MVEFVGEVGVRQGVRLLLNTNGNRFVVSDRNGNDFIAVVGGRQVIGGEQAAGHHEGDGQQVRREDGGPVRHRA